MAPAVDAWQTVPPAPEPPPPPPPVAPPDLEDVSDAILGRNLFDHAAIGAEVDDPGDGPALTDLQVRLLGTMVAVPAELSAALIAPDDPDIPATTYVVGDQLDDATIVRIEPRVVTLRRATGEIELLTADDDPYAAALRSGEPVIKVAKDSYLVLRSAVQDLVAHPTGVARARVTRRKGKTSGIKLTRIQRSSLLYKASIRNGETVTAINGVPLTSLQEAIALGQNLANLDELDIELERRGQTRTVHIEVL